MTDLTVFFIFISVSCLLVSNVCILKMCFSYKIRISKLEEKVQLLMFKSFITSKENLDKSSLELLEAFDKVINREDG